MGGGVGGSQVRRRGEGEETNIQVVVRVRYVPPLSFLPRCAFMVKYKLTLDFTMQFILQWPRTLRDPHLRLFHPLHLRSPRPPNLRRDRASPRLFPLDAALAGSRDATGKDVQFRSGLWT